MKAAVTSRDRFYLVDHIAAFHYFSEHTITEPLLIGGAVVQEVVIHNIEEKLCRRRVRIGSAGHGDGVSIVLQSIAGFVLDRGANRLLLHPGLEPAALNHKAVYYPMEYGVVVEALA